MRYTGKVPLWRGTEMMLVTLVAAAGMGLVFFAWYGAADQVETDQQIGWLNLSLAGAIVTAVGLTVWILSGRRVVAIRLREVTGRLAVALGATVPVPQTHSNSIQLVALPDGQYAHRLECQILEGRQADAVGVEAGVLPRCAWCDASEPMDAEGIRG